MMRGQEEPCIPRAGLAKFQQAYDRPCPRVELEPENSAVAYLAHLALQPERYGWALPGLLQMTPFYGQRRLDVVWRIISATNAEGVTERITQRQEQARKEAERRAAASHRTKVRRR